MTFNLNSKQDSGEPIAEYVAMNDDRKAEREHAEPVEEASPLVLHAEALFGDRREIWIELDGVRYRLRITRRNKLILQK